MLTAIFIAGGLLSAVCLLNVLLSKGTGLHELSWVLGTVAGVAIMVLGYLLDTGRI